MNRQLIASALSLVSFMAMSQSGHASDSCVVTDPTGTKKVTVSKDRKTSRGRTTSIQVTSYVYDTDIYGNVVKDEALYQVTWNVKNDRYEDDWACISSAANPGTKLGCLNRNKHSVFADATGSRELFLYLGNGIVSDLTNASVAAIVPTDCATEEALLGAYTLSIQD